MKTLYLVRHAKSDWDNEDLADIYRPLNARGYRNAQQMSELMGKKKLLPDVIISSPAIRAYTTALIFSNNFNYDPADIIIDNNLYETPIEEYTNSILRSDDRHKSIMLFAHNPTISELANVLTDSFSDNIPTCGIIAITNNCKNWKNFTHTAGKLLFYDFPKNHL